MGWVGKGWDLRLLPSCFIRRYMSKHRICQYVVLINANCNVDQTREKMEQENIQQLNCLYWLGYRDLKLCVIVDCLQFLLASIQWRYHQNLKMPTSSRHDSKQLLSRLSRGPAKTPTKKQTFESSLNDGLRWTLSLSCEPATYLHTYALALSSHRSRHLNPHSQKLTHCTTSIS